MALDGTPFLVQAVYSFKGKNNDEVIVYICYLRVGLYNTSFLTESALA
jgi:hypothetical protein